MEVTWQVLRVVGRGTQQFRHLSKVVTPASENQSSSDVKKFLVEMDMPYIDGFTCLQSQCKLCSIKAPGNLYINKTTGFFTCVKCKSYGEWAALHRVFCSLSEPAFKKSDLSEIKSPLQGIKLYPKEPTFKDTLTSIHKKSKGDINLLCQQFNIPVTDREVFDQLNVCIDSTGSSMYFPFQTIDSVIAGYKVISKTTRDETTLLGANQSGLIILKPERLKSFRRRSSQIKELSSAVLVVSVSDALALARSGTQSHIICLPHGISILPIEILPMFEKYNKITFWFGDCVGLWDSIRCFAKKLNAKRCYAVKPCARTPSASIAHQNGKDLVGMLSEARPLYVEDVTSFEGLRGEVMSELLNVGKFEGIKWRCFPALNDLLKGFRRGELTVLSGSTGSGKTTLMSQYSLDLAEQGVNTLWGSFEIPNHRLARTLLTQMAGMPLQLHMDRFDEFADKFEKLPIYFMKLHGQHSIDKVMKVIEHAQYVYDVGHVIIDTVQFMMGVTEDASGMDRFWRQDNIIASFRSFATLTNCHVTLVIHPRKERPGENLNLNSVFGGAKATQEADNVFMLQDYREAKGGLFLKVLKNRFCGDVGNVPLEFNKASLRFTQNKFFLATKPGKDDKNSWRNIDVLG